ncbi:MAG: DNRLRE domain-containing protein [Dehalococcoidia bacterium]|jgi:hypothetical protein
MWKSKTIKLALVGLVILTMILAGGCNKPPTIASLTPSATEVARGESCTVSCTASDENADDVLTYAWSATGGSVSGTGDTITWMAPTTTGSYTITVTVSDGEEAASDSCNITVVNTPPVITSLTPSATELPPEGSCTISCAASDADGDSLTYTWSATDGTITGTGDSVTWEAPAAEGTYTISVEVSDGSDTTSDSCDIVVEMKYGSIDTQSSPAGAAVYLNGVDTGNITPYVITGLEPGSYTVMLYKYHYKYREQTVTVNPNETSYINWSLTYAPEQTLNIQPNAAIGKDTYVYDSAPDDNWGTLDRVTAGYDVATLVRAYLQFNLDLLPEDAIITGARIGLVYYSTSSSVISSIGAYNVEEAWGEDTMTWNNQPAFSATVEDTASVPAGVTDGFVYWYIEDLVKGWFDGTITNYGVVLKATDETTEEAWKRFHSSDWSTAHQRPELTILYFDPTS